MVVEGAMKPHLAILPSPGMGHIIPLLEFAKHLVTYHDFHISFLLITSLEPTPISQKQILSSTNLPSDLCVIHLPPVDLSAIVTDDTTLIRRLYLTIAESFKSLKKVLTELSNSSLKALIVDIFTTDAYEICKELSVPIYSFFTASATFLTFLLYSTNSMEYEVEPESDPAGQSDMIRIPGCKPIRQQDLDDVPDPDSEEDKWCVLQFARLRLLDGIFVNSWEDLDPVSFRALRENPFYKKILTAPVHPVGPLTREGETLTESDVDCIKWLNKQDSESVLFVSLGSGGILSSEQLIELAFGLELSQQRFIWVVRPPSEGRASSGYFDHGYDANNPKHYLPEGFLKRTHGVGLVVPSWAPQVTILRHPSTGGFLSHCGWNSVLESIVCGVPMIAWPLYSEQKLTASMLTAEDQIRMAVRPKAKVERGVVDRKEVERVVRLVMEGKDGQEGRIIRNRAKELKESANKALNHGGSSFQSLSCMAEKWRSS